MDKTKRIEILNQTDLYPVISREFNAGRSSLEILDGVLAAGVKIVQMREKNLPMREKYELALAFRRKTSEAGALFIVNDQIDLALAVEADGVHLGQDDFPLVPARRLAPELILGRSTHNLDQALEAERDGADYVNIGPIYATGTKPEHKVFLEPRIIAEIAPQLHIPFTVMGGIKETNLQPVLDAGARHIAVVTAVSKAEDVTLAARRLRERIATAVRT